MSNPVRVAPRRQGGVSSPRVETPAPLTRAGHAESVPPKATKSVDADDFVARSASNAILAEYLAANRANIEQSIRDILGEKIFGYLTDDITMDIRSNADGGVFIQQFGSQEVSADIIFPRVASMQFVQLLAQSNGVSLTAESPSIDGIVPYYGYRTAAMIAPVVSGVAWTIRKRIGKNVSLSSYVEKNMMTEKQLARIERMIDENKSILVVAPQATGKTTLANAVLNAVYDRVPSTRFCIIEDTSELQCVAPNKIEMLVHYPTNHTFHALISKQLRYGATSLSIGELRAQDVTRKQPSVASALLYAWNAGSTRTGIATIFGKSPAQGLNNFELLLQIEDFPVDRDLIADSIGGIICMKKDRNNIPRVTDVTSIVDTNGGHGYTFETLA